MTALSADRNTPRAEGDSLSFGVAAGELIYGGALVALNAAGYAAKGATGTGLVGAGRAEERVDNSAGAAGDETIKVRTGTFRFANSAGSDEITIAERGKVCFIVDDQTVAKTSNSGARSPAGIVVDVDSLGVWVHLDPALTRAAVAAASTVLGEPSFTIGAEASNVINVAIQLKDILGADLAHRAAVEAYLSDDANGDTVAGTAPDTVAIGTDGVAIPLVAGKRFTLISEADGDIDINLTEDGADTWYLVLVVDGRLYVSGAITFA